MTHFLLLLAAQDLFRPEPPEELRRRISSDPRRLDLRLDADFEPVASSRSPARFELPLEGEFVWNAFDLKENYRKLLSKNVREEILESILDRLVDELTDSSMTLLCQVSPTTCDSLKHYRLTTNDQMAMDLDLTRSVEEKSGDTQGSIVASAIKSCLKERRRKGDSLSEALKHCRESGGAVRSLAGSSEKRYDLLSDVGRSAGLDDSSQGLLRRLGANRSVEGGTLRETGPEKAVVSEYATLRREYAGAWERATAGKGGEEALIPPGVPPVTDDEIQSILDAPPAQRRAMIASLASAAALVELTRRVHEAERALETASYSPNADEETRQRLARDRERLRSELDRLVEEHDRERLYRDALRRVRSAAEEERRERLERVAEAEALRLRERRLEPTTGKWGTDCPGCGRHPSAEK